MFLETFNVFGHTQKSKAQKVGMLLYGHEGFYVAMSIVRCVRILVVPYILLCCK